ncbi:MAG: XRE family transcriptional regulator [Polaromonas sp.]|nr:XRE family transcriptional regulator [Polaromonas sp.]
MLSERLKKAMEAAGMSQADLARACKVSAPSVNGWLNGKSKFLRGENLLSAAKALNVSEQWLANGIGPMHPRGNSEAAELDLDSHPDLTPIRKVKLRLQAGVNGFAVEPEEEDGPPIFFRNDWLQQRGYKPYNLLAVKVKGHSMEDKLYAGDLVVIHTADIEPQDGEVFAVNYEGEPVIKRLKRERGSWWLASDNQDKARYPDKECIDSSCIIVGRIVHKQSERI